MIDYRKLASDAHKRLGEIDKEREHLLALLEHAKALSGVTSKIADAPTVRVSNAMTPTQDATRAILNDAGRPMAIRELLPKVRERGVEVGGKDPIATLSARLSNSSEFKSRRGIGWWFADRPIPGEIEFEEAEDVTVEGSPSASSEEDNNGGKSNAAALNLHD